MDPKQEQQPVKKNFHVGLLTVLVLIAIIEFFMLLNKNGQLPSVTPTRRDEVVEAPVQENVMEGVFSLSADKVATIGAPMTFVVKADSNNRRVVGFDAVVEYDTTAFTLGSVRSSLEGFTTTSSTRKKYLEVTSSKDLQTVVTPVLQDTEVLTFTLTPRKAGSYTIVLVDQVDGSSTKYVDSDTQTYSPRVNSVEVMVK